MQQPEIQHDDSIRAYLSTAKKYLSAKLSLAMYYLKETPIERAIGVGALGLATLVGSCHAESKRASILPLSFSEIEQRELDAQLSDIPINSTTKCFAGANETVMKIFESNNYAQEAVMFKDDYFARELEVRMDKRTSSFAPITKYTKTMPADCQGALNALRQFIQLRQELLPVIDAFDKSWKENHHDVTHIEVDTTTDCDFEGRCTIRTTTREVYDYTIHTYTYYREHGERASRLLDELVKKHPTLQLKENIPRVTITNAENEYAIERSRSSQLNGKRLSEAELLRYANNWVDGSTLNSLYPVILGGHTATLNFAPSWRNAKKTARGDQYRTYSRSDSGPKEFQVSQTTLSNSTKMQANLSELITSIEFARDNATQIESKINQFVAVQLDKEPGNAKKIKKELMDLSKATYSKMFRAGFEIDTFRTHMVLLWTFLGAVAGYCVGFGVDKTAEKYGWWEQRRIRNFVK